MFGEISIGMEARENLNLVQNLELRAVDEYAPRNLAAHQQGTPWPDLYLVGHPTLEMLERVDAELALQGLEGHAWHIEKKRILSKLLHDQHRDIIAGLSDADLEDIAKWFVERDAQYPDLVSTQVTYFDSEEGKYWIADGVLKQGFYRSGFWNISSKAYEAEGDFGTYTKVPPIVSKDILQRIGTHYLAEFLSQ